MYIDFHLSCYIVQILPKLPAPYKISR